MKLRQAGISDGKIVALVSGIVSGVVAVSVAAFFVIRALIPISGEQQLNNSSSAISVNSEVTQIQSGEDSSQIISSSIAQTEDGELVYESDDGTSFDVPSKLRAVYLKPGQDFLLKTTDSEQTIKAQIETALKNVSDLGFNSVIVFTKTTYGVIYNDSELSSVKSDFDILSYIIDSAKSKKIYTYAVYPVFVKESEGKIENITDLSNTTLKSAQDRAAAFAKKYSPSGIIFDNYTVKKSQSMQADFELNGKGRSYDDYLRAQVSEGVRLAKNSMRQNNKTSQIGLLTSGVWANKTTDARGSNTDSDFESLVDGFADTRDFVLAYKFNFVMVENVMPTDSVRNNFSAIANWWSSLCSQADVEFYNVHAASKLSTSLGEFASPDQLIRQVSLVKPLKAYGGSVFDSLTALIADYEGSTSLLIKYFNDEIKNSLVFSKLKMTSPSSNNVTTYENSIMFSGASDPNFQTLFNGKPITVTEKGYFTIDAGLNIGTNTFKITHKGKTVSYTVVRKVKLLESVSPMGTIEVDGQTVITLSAVGYAGSKVTAQIGSQTVTLVEQKPEQTEEEGSISSQYVRFEGNFKTPAATTSVQNLGAVTYNASWQTFSEKMTGANIKIYAKPLPPPIEKGNAVQITAQHAETFPTDRLNDQSQPYCYPLPAGTKDFIVGNELSFTSGSETFKYYKLQSGHRVYSKDVKVIGNIDKENNEISSVDVSYDGRYVNLSVQNKWSVPFKCIEDPISYASDGRALSGNYQATKVTYRIFYTDKVDTEKITIDKNNPLISDVNCELKKVKVDSVEIPVCDIVLTLKTTSGFFGATPLYSENTLKISLNTPAPIQKSNNSYGYTLKGAVIVIDAGHDKLSPGTPGNLKNPETGQPAYYEYQLNEAVREKIVAILRNLGATVITVDNSQYRYAAQRLSYFKSVKPHLMISIHHNAATNAYPRGPVGIYYNSYSQLLSKYVMDSVASNYINNSSNRAYRHTFQSLSMLREPYYPSMLIECGFMSNAAEMEDLIVPENQQKIASQMVKGMINYFVNTGSLNYASIESDEASSSSEVSDSSSSQIQNDSSSISQTESEISTVETSETAVAYFESKKKLIA